MPSMLCIEVRKRAKIRNRYNQAPHLTQDTNGNTRISILKTNLVFVVFLELELAISQSIDESLITNSASATRKQFNGLNTVASEK